MPGVDRIRLTFAVGTKCTKAEAYLYGGWAMAGASQ